MKKLRLSCITYSLTLFAMISSADASIIASGDAALTGTNPLHADTFAASPAPVAGAALTVHIPEETMQKQPGEKLNYFTAGTSADSPPARSHTNLWLLLIAASILGLLSEVFHRNSRNR